MRFNEIVRRTVDEIFNTTLKRKGTKSVSQYSALDEDSDYDEVGDLMRLRRTSG